MVGYFSGFEENYFPATFVIIRFIYLMHSGIEKKIHTPSPKDQYSVFNRIFSYG